MPVFNNLLQEEEEKEEEEQARLKEAEQARLKQSEQPQLKEAEMVQEDVALNEMVLSTAREAQELAKTKTLEKREVLCNLSRALAVLASASVRMNVFLDVVCPYLTFIM